MPSIDGHFDFRHRNDDGSFRMYVWNNREEKNRLYIKNRHGKKLLQLVVNDEVDKVNSDSYAQIKIIPYRTKKARIYNDSINDPNIIRLLDNVEFTYHGGPKDDENPKIHMKCITSHRHRYQTLLDCSLPLTKDAQILLPLFSLFPGHLYKNKKNDRIKKKAYKFIIDSSNPVRIDFYLSGNDIDMEKYFNSMYSINMFFSLDYLIEKEGCPLQGHPIVQPITGFKMKGYYLWIRCSNYSHIGNPFLQFYNNYFYYEKVMNRRIAYPNDDGSLTWKTMMEKEQEISQYFKELEEKKANKANYPTENSYAVFGRVIYDVGC